MPTGSARLRLVAIVALVAAVAIAAVALLAGSAGGGQAATLPTCSSGGSTSERGNLTKTGREVPCATWHPRDNPDPPGCTWFTVPPEPDDG